MKWKDLTPEMLRTAGEEMFQIAQDLTHDPVERNIGRALRAIDRYVKREANRRERKAAEPTWVRLYELPPGSVFETQKGTRAVKTDYRVNLAICCYLLNGGDAAHFAQDVTDPVERAAAHNDTLCRVLKVSR